MENCCLTQCWEPLWGVEGWEDGKRRRARAGDGWWVGEFSLSFFFLLCNNFYLLHCVFEAISRVFVFACTSVFVFFFMRDDFDHNWFTVSLHKPTETTMTAISLIWRAEDRGAWTSLREESDWKWRASYWPISLMWGAYVQNIRCIYNITYTQHYNFKTLEQLLAWVLSSEITVSCLWHPALSQGKERVLICCPNPAFLNNIGLWDI